MIFRQATLFRLHEGFVHVQQNQLDQPRQLSLRSCDVSALIAVQAFYDVPIDSCRMGLWLWIGSHKVRAQQRYRLLFRSVIQASLQNDGHSLRYASDSLLHRVHQPLKIG